MKIPARKSRFTRLWSCMEDKDLNKLKKGDLILYYPLRFSYVKEIGVVIDFDPDGDELVEVRPVKGFYSKFDRDNQGWIGFGNIIKNIDKEYPEFCI